MDLESQRHASSGGCCASLWRCLCCPCLCVWDMLRCLGDCLCCALRFILCCAIWCVTPRARCSAGADPSALPGRPSAGAYGDEKPRERRPPLTLTGTATREQLRLLCHQRSRLSTASRHRSRPRAPKHSCSSKRRLQLFVVASSNLFPPRLPLTASSRPPPPRTPTHGTAP
jgi:hypothetical protein